MESQLNNSTIKSPAISDDSQDVLSVLKKSRESLLSLQRNDGYWWFTLEANESIGAEFIFLMHFLEDVDPKILKGVANRILDVQREDGTWALYYDGPADLSTTIECYLALRLAGYSKDESHMVKARDFIIKAGGAENCRVFTLIHFALFGIVPWKVVPEMPAEFIFAPTTQMFNIYEFSSWARATIVPLFVIGTIKPVLKLSNDINIDELFVNAPNKRKFKYAKAKNFFSFEKMVLIADKMFRIYSSYSPKSLRKLAINKCLSWIRNHINCTEDIYPALAYGAMAFKAAGYSNSSIEIQKPFNALKMFQQGYNSKKLPFMPDELPDNGKERLSNLRDSGAIDCTPKTGGSIHQQCCISPVWDTPWTILALLSAGVSPSHPSLLKTGEWLLKKQIRKVKGDWAIKNPDTKPGGWSFEFENDYFPDVDDTIAVISVLDRLDLPEDQKRPAIKLALEWLISMQNDDGGWGAFDKNNQHEWVNKIPFSDHKACLDSSSPDITGRMIELFAEHGLTEHVATKKAVKYLLKTQEAFGGWFARWGINYIYGTWCAVTGLTAVGLDSNHHPALKKASFWLQSIQNKDGGFGESPASYDKKKFIPCSSCPSQTAWGLMALTALGLSDSTNAGLAVNYLLNEQDDSNLWSEDNYTGTGFPGHFYIRYHGYARYFPLLALGKWSNGHFS